MYCNPDLVLYTVTDCPSVATLVDVGGVVDWGICTTPSMSAYDVVGFDSNAYAANATVV